ncbi:MAG: hypothetical protein IT462_06130 [Planctomycetes bacterium]|nr:hypothetical protein [Planctomycetota bacterium]
MIKRLLAIVAALTLALLALAGAPSSHAQGSFERALRGLDVRGAVLNRIGDYAWLERDGIAIKLVAAPGPRKGGHWLIAGEVMIGRPSIGLYRLATDATTLRDNLAAKGAVFGAASAFTFRDRAQVAVNGQSTPFAVANGAPGLLSAFGIGAFNYALVQTATSASTDLVARRQDLLGDMYVLPGMKAGSIAPLFDDGRYAGRLDEFERDGEAFVKRNVRGRMLLQTFVLNRGNMDDIAVLQRELEDRFKKQEIRRTLGNRVTVAEQEGFVGEYFHAQGGDMLRVIYAPIADGYVIVVVSGPDATRDDLKAEADAFAASVVQLPLPPAPEHMLPLASARTVRLVAWQDGAKLMWGVSFDDNAGRQVLWREPGTRWDAKLTLEGAAPDTKAGQANSSRELNPLVDAEYRAFRVPAEGRIAGKLEFNLGGLRATLELTP